MQVVHTIFTLRSLLHGYRQELKSIGFVPTMGALHDGHIELVKKCISENDICVVSIFVNPTQFNDKNDLLKYPRTLEADCKLLKAVGCHFVFTPEVEEIYPETDNRRFNFGSLEQVMEGKFRPGHFNGVAQVVSKLFDITQPDRAYFGEKDFQQLTIIRAMVHQLNYPVKIVPCPIVREADGLAMSSRNRRLTPGQTKHAPVIYRTLLQSFDSKNHSTISGLKKQVIETIEKTPELKVEYFEIIDGNTLQSISEWNSTKYIIGCIAAFCGEIRLIDNITYINN